MAKELEKHMKAKTWSVLALDEEHAIGQANYLIALLLKSNNQ